MWGFAGGQCVPVGHPLDQAGWDQLALSGSQSAWLLFFIFKYHPFRLVGTAQLKEKVVAEASKDRASLSESPLPEEMPPPTAEGPPVGPNSGTRLPKRKRGAITPSSQPKGETPTVVGVGVI